MYTDLEYTLKMGHIETNSSSGQILKEAISNSSGHIIAVNPAKVGARQIVQEILESKSWTPVKVFATKDALEASLSEFLIASRTADLINNGQLEIAYLDAENETELLISKEKVTIPISENAFTVVTASEDNTVGELYEEFNHRFESATQHKPRTPALVSIQESLADEVGQSVRADLESVLDSEVALTGESDSLNIVELMVLLAARNRAENYTISKWGEDVGIASRATFSRTKKSLEEGGLIATEKIPQKIGRPRLRLLLATEELKEYSPVELAKQAPAHLNS